MSVASLLDYVSVLRWPLLVGAFLFFFFRRYKEHVGRLIDRIQSVSGPLGTGAQFGLPSEQDDHDEADAVHWIDEQTELVEAITQEYQAELESAEYQHQQEVEYLLTRLARTELRADYEFVYGHIYGSQIEALRTMRANGLGAPRTAVEAHLTQAKSIFSSVPFIQNLSFEDWFGFLRRNELAEGPDAAGLYQITPKGAGFLAYIDALSRPGRFF